MTNPTKQKPKKVNNQGATTPPTKPAPKPKEKGQAESTGTGDFWKKEKR